MIRLIWLVAFCHLAIISIPLAVILPDVTIISAILAMIPWGGAPFLSLGDYFYPFGDYLSRWGDYSRNFGDDPIAEVPLFCPAAIIFFLLAIIFPNVAIISATLAIIAREEPPILILGDYPPR
nr:hypothetical protein [Bacilli bacterium]